jgi:hypothetical protein
VASTRGLNVPLEKGNDGVELVLAAWHDIMAVMIQPRWSTLWKMVLATSA